MMAIYTMNHRSEEMLAALETGSLNLIQKATSGASKDIIWEVTYFLC
jgi:hypothetical protein